MDHINAAASVLQTALNESNLQGVLDEVVAILPMVLGVAIEFIGIRKGISFVIGMLRSA